MATSNPFKEAATELVIGDPLQTSAPYKNRSLQHSPNNFAVAGHEAVSVVSETPTQNGLGVNVVDKTQHVVACGDLEVVIQKTKIHVGLKMRFLITTGAVATILSIVGANVYQGELAPQGTYLLIVTYSAVQF